VNFLGRLLDRLSWPVLVVAGVAAIGIAVALVFAMMETPAPRRELANIVDRTVRISEEAGRIAEQAAEQAVKKVAPPSAPEPPKAPVHDEEAAPPPAPPMPMPPSNLEARIRKRVHDELARVQRELQQAQQDALQEHEDKRREAEQAITDAQRELEEKQRDAETELRDAKREFAAKQAEIGRQMGQTHGDASRLRDLLQEQRESRKEYEEQRRQYEKAMRDAKLESQKAVEAAHREMDKEAALLGEGRSYKVPTIKIPEIKIPEIKIPEIKIPPMPASPPIVAVWPPTPASPAVPAAPAAPSTKPVPLPGVTPLSNDAMQLVERDVGSAVADTIGEEVHSALKGYRLVVSGLLIGFALLLFAGAVIGKSVMASNRAARARADLLRVQAERNLMSKQVVEAQLKMMQAQVEPHFLFNTLANVRFLMEADAAAASTMLDHLIDYLHAALPQMRENSTTLGREAELARAYLEILKIRMGNRLQFAISVPENLQGVSLPPMMLLSLVENAIKHGLEPKREGGRLDIDASAAGGRLRVAVSDTGVGLDGAAAAQSGSGVGLANIRDRLQALYGAEGRLALVENQPQGVVAAIEIPYG
jgi:chemotaxis protein histidine kinase CheA